MSLDTIIAVRKNKTTNVFTGLYNSNNDVTKDAKLPAVISPELIK